MSRPSSSLLRSLPLPLSRVRTAFPPAILQRRALLGGASSPSPSSSPSRNAGNTTSIDQRILQGVDGFLPKENFDRITEWQAGLWRRLQDEVRNNPALIETKQKWDKYGLDMTDLVSSTARDGQLTLAYNYSALLLNNSFFLEGLTAEGPKRIPNEYRALQEKVEGFADGIVGGGWLWIVRAGENEHDLDVIPTFGSGTLLVTNRAQRGREERALFSQPKTSGSGSDIGESEPSSTSPSAPETAATPAPANKRSRSSYPYSLSSSSARLDSYPVPVAVLNLYEHAYLGDKYGVWGKREYARDWWNALDWNLVAKRSATIS